jgi:hypothetical protein
MNRLLGQVHLTPCARTQGRADIVATESCAGSNRHFWGRDGRCELVPKLEIRKAAYSSCIRQGTLESGTVSLMSDKL